MSLFCLLKVPGRVLFTKQLKNCSATCPFSTPPQGRPHPPISIFSFSSAFRQSCISLRMLVCLLMLDTVLGAKNHQRKRLDSFSWVQLLKVEPKSNHTQHVLFHMCYVYDDQERHTCIGKEKKLHNFKKIHCNKILHNSFQPFPPDLIQSCN